MSDTFLSAAEVETLTGYKLAAYQARWLKRNGVRFFRQRITGLIIVPREALVGKAKGGEIEGPRLDWKGHGRKAA